MCIMRSAAYTKAEYFKSCMILKPAGFNFKGYTSQLDDLHLIPIMATRIQREKQKKCAMPYRYTIWSYPISNDQETDFAPSIMLCLSGLIWASA